MHFYPGVVEIFSMKYGETGFIGPPCMSYENNYEHLSHQSFAYIQAVVLLIPTNMDVALFACYLFLQVANLSKPKIFRTFSKTSLLLNNCWFLKKNLESLVIYFAFEF